MQPAVPSQNQTAPRPAGMRAALALALCAFVLYNVNFRAVSSGDNFPARYLPFAILGHGTLCLDPLKSVVSQGSARPYWVIRGRNGCIVSQYPVVTPILVAPLYLPAVAYLDWRGWTDGRIGRLARLMEKISASLIASVSVALVHLLLRRQVDARAALLLAVAYAFGTNTWMIGSQGLWQHGMGELLLAAALLLVTGPSTPMARGRAFAAGALCALAAFNRPPDVILAAAIGLYSLRWAGRQVLFVVAGAAIPSALLLAYNIGMLGNIVGGYVIAANAHFFRFSLPLGVAGLLFSPGRGLLVFSPFLAALPLGLRRGWRDRTARGLSILIYLAFVLQMAVYAKTDWRGGASWGPRYLTDALPLLVWLLAPALRGMRPAARGAFGVAVAASIAIQVVGAFWYTGKSDEAMGSTSGDPARWNGVWNLKSTPFLCELRHPPAARDLLLKIEGGIDSITAGGGDTAEAPAGTPLTVAGWTLADGHAPSNVVVTLVPGPGMPASQSILYPVAIVRDFTPRPGTPAPARPDARAGWQAVLNTKGLPPGKYALEVFAEGGEGGEYRPVAQRAFTITGGN